MAVRDKSNRFTAIEKVNGRVDGSDMRVLQFELPFRSAILFVSGCRGETRPEPNPDYNFHHVLYIALYRVGDAGSAESPASGTSASFNRQ